MQFPAGSKASPQFCLCIIGLVGSGKTTLVKKIITKLPMVRVSGDDVRVILKQKGLSVEHASEVVRLVSTSLKQQGYNVAHDSDIPRPAVRHILAKENKHITELWIRVAPPESFILHNLTHRPPDLIFRNAADAIQLYYERKALHASLPDLELLPYLYVFDTSLPDLDQQIDEFVAVAQAKLKVQ